MFVPHGVDAVSGAEQVAPDVVVGDVCQELDACVRDVQCLAIVLQFKDAILVGLGTGGADEFQCEEIVVVALRVIFSVD